jgi:hypothetical protein
MTPPIEGNLPRGMCGWVCVCVGKEGGFWMTGSVTERPERLAKEGTV